MHCRSCIFTGWVLFSAHITKRKCVTILLNLLSLQTITARGIRLFTQIIHLVRDEDHTMCPQHWHRRHAKGMEMTLRLFLTNEVAHH